MGHGINVSVRPKRAEGLGAIGRAEGHRGVGGRACCPAAESIVIVRNGPCTPEFSVASPGAPDLRHRGARQGRLRAAPARAACRCTCAARRRTTCRTSVTGARRSCSTRSAATSMWCGLARDVRQQRHRRRGQDHRARRSARARPSRSSRRKYEAEFWEQIDRLNIMRPDEMPRATECIEQMQALIAELVDRGHAYVIEGEGVYFQVDSLPEYGGLSHRTLEELLESAGARVEVDERKRSPVDFALWKAAKPGEPCWESPWGPGRPGWHIECSAMSLEILGDGFDIHGGGNDLVFPHHENEIAQARGRRPRVRAPLDPQRHAQRRRREDVEVARQLHDARRRARPLRPARVPHARAEDALPPADGGRRRRSSATRRRTSRSFDALLRRARDAEAARRGAARVAASSAPRWTTTSTRRPRSPCCRSCAATRTPRSTRAASTTPRSLVATVRSLAGALGLELSDAAMEIDDDVAALVEQRDAARAAKDFAESDRIRDELLGARHRARGHAERHGLAPELMARPKGRLRRADRRRAERRRAGRRAGRGPAGGARAAPRRPARRCAASRCRARCATIPCSTRSASSPGRALKVVDPERIDAARAHRRAAGRDRDRGAAARRRPRRAAAVARRASSSRSTASAIPRNLGAVARVAETAGATGLVLPAPSQRARHARGREGRGRRDRVPADRARRRDPGRARARAPRRVLDDRPRRSRPTSGRCSTSSSPTNRSCSCSAPRAAGLPRLTSARCDVLVSIPMRGAIASLNVAAAAALACHEIGRRRATLRLTL